MFDIGFSELLLVLIIGLIVLGPERLPVVVRAVAGWLRTARSMSAAVQQQLAEELRLDDMRKDLNTGLKKAGELSTEVAKEVTEVRGKLDDVGQRTADSLHSVENPLHSHQEHKDPSQS